MGWYEIAIGLVSGGVISTLLSVYNAKSNKMKIDISNMQVMLNEAHKMYDESAKRYEQKTQEFEDYKASNMKYIAEFKERFAKMEARMDKAEESVLRLKGAVFQGYRCKFPENIEDCPVIKEYEKKVQCPKVAGG